MDNISKITPYLSFSLGKELFAIEAQNVLSIQVPKTLTKVPQSEDYLRGMINLRGEALPIIDLQVKIGMGKTVIEKETCILVVEQKKHNEKIKLGVLVDSVHDVLEINESGINEPPKIGIKQASSYINGTWQKNDRFVMLIDFNKILLKDKIEKINTVGEAIV